MKAIYQQRTTNQSDHTELGNAAPLNTPFVIMVDPSSQCNFQCRFCCTGDRARIASTGRFQGPMPIKLFYKLINDINEFPDQIKVLRFYKEGEPLMHRQFTEMVKYARQNNKIKRIDMTTNGALLNPNLNEKLINAGIDQINISVNGVSDEQFKHYVRANVDFKQYVENIRHLYSIRGKCEIYVKAIQENLTEEEQKQFLNIFGEIADRIFFEHLSPAWPGFTFNNIPMKFTVGHYGQSVLERMVCPYIFYAMVINSDGSVSTCVQDWEHKLIMGTVLEESLYKIWNGTKFDNHRMMHLNCQRKTNDVCKVCDVMSYGVLNNIDPHITAIRERLQIKIKGKQ